MKCTKVETTCLNPYVAFLFQREKTLFTLPLHLLNAGMKAPGDTLTSIPAGKKIVILNSSAVTWLAARLKAFLLRVEIQGPKSASFDHTDPPLIKMEVGESAAGKGLVHRR